MLAKKGSLIFKNHIVVGKKKHKSHILEKNVWSVTATRWNFRQEIL